MSRVHADNLLWVCCCCGCLPIIGLIKGLILCIPVSIFCMLPCTLLSIVMLPHDIILTYWTLIRAKHLGPNITALCMLLLPIPLLLWPVFVIICSFGFGLGLGFGYPSYCTFDSSHNLLFGGFYESFEVAVKYIKEFMSFNTEAVFVYLEDYRLNREGYDYFDISMIQAIVSLFLGLFCSIIDGALMILIATVYLGPVFLRAFYEMWRMYLTGLVKGCCDGSDCISAVCWIMSIPFFLVGNVLLPVGIILGYVLVILTGFANGVRGGYVSYTEGFLQTLRYIFVVPVAVESYALHWVTMDLDSSRYGEGKQTCLMKLMCCAPLLAEAYETNQSAARQKREDEERKKDREKIDEEAEVRRIARELDAQEAEEARAAGVAGNGGAGSAAGNANAPRAEGQPRSILKNKNGAGAGAGAAGVQPLDADVDDDTPVPHINSNNGNVFDALEAQQAQEAIDAVAALEEERLNRLDGLHNHPSHHAAGGGGGGGGGGAPGGLSLPVQREQDEERFQRELEMALKQSEEEERRKQMEKEKAKEQSQPQSSSSSSSTSQPHDEQHHNNETEEQRRERRRKEMADAVEKRQKHEHEQHQHQANGNANGAAGAAPPSSSSLSRNSHSHSHVVDINFHNDSAAADHHEHEHEEDPASQLPLSSAHDTPLIKQSSTSEVNEHAEL